MDRCVILVDAGYLLGAAASLLTGESSRNLLSVNFPDLVARLRERAAEATGLPVLRVYWFDAAPNRIPLPEHRLLRALPRVTVRLGVLTQTAGRPTQKGVDAAIHAVLSDLAQRKACADVVMVTGDGDLQPAIVAAKDHGVALHVWAVQAADGEFNQSEELIAEADERQVLDLAWIRASVSPAQASATGRQRSREEEAILRAPRSELSVVAAGESGRHAPPPPVPAADALPASALEPCVPNHEHIPTPKEIAELHRKHDAELAAAHAVDPALRWSSDLGMVDDRLLPTLGEVTERGQQWQDREEDMTSVSGEPTEVGRVYARRWAMRVSDVQLAALRTAYPRVPRQLDGELLRYAARFNLLTGQDDRIDQDARYMIRDGFWREIEDCGTGEKLRVPEHAKAEHVKSDHVKTDHMRFDHARAEHPDHADAARASGEPAPRDIPREGTPAGEAPGPAEGADRAASRQSGPAQRPDGQLAARGHCVPDHPAGAPGQDHQRPARPIAALAHDGHDRPGTPYPAPDESSRLKRPPSVPEHLPIDGAARQVPQPG